MLWAFSVPHSALNRILCGRVLHSLELCRVSQRTDCSAASERLYDAESSASVDQRRATHNANASSAFHSAIYDPGTEYALCQAMAEIMGAVVGVLNESLTEAIRGFYKMRKAYMTLDSILKMEERYLQRQQSERSQGSSSSHLSVNSQSAPEQSASSSTSSLSRSAEKSDEELARDISQLQVSEADLAVPNSTGRSNLVLSEVYKQDPDSEEFSCTIDAFIHSGANLCFGILLLILSMIPPTFGRLLAIIGFRGDKERGLRMLWQASAYNNLIGAIAAEGILGYYNGFVRYCDIVPDAQTENELEVEGYPAERLAALLKKMRARYPRSQLWLLEEARMEGANRNLAAALTLMNSGEKSPLKQVEALRMFELSMTAMYLHRYEECATSFLKVCTLISELLEGDDTNVQKSASSSIHGLRPCTTTSLAQPILYCTAGPWPRIRPLRLSIRKKQRST